MLQYAKVLGFLLVGILATAPLLYPVKIELAVGKSGLVVLYIAMIAWFLLSSFIQGRSNRIRKKEKSGASSASTFYATNGPVYIVVGILCVLFGGSVLATHDNPVLLVDKINSIPVGLAYLFFGAAIFVSGIVYIRRFRR